MRQAVEPAGFVFLAGVTVKAARGGTVTQQAREMLQLIDGVLPAAGRHKSRLVAANVWLTDIATSTNSTRVADAGKPVRACVEAKLADPLLLNVGISITAR